MPYENLKIDDANKESKMIISYFAAFLIFQWPLLQLIREYRFPIFLEIDYLKFDGYYIIFSLIAGFAIPMIWVIRQRILGEIGIRKLGLLKNIIIIAPLSFWLIVSICGAAQNKIIYRQLPMAFFVLLFGTSLPEEFLLRPLLQERIERSLGRWYALILVALIYALFYFPKLWLFPEDLITILKVDKIDLLYIMGILGTLKFSFGLMMGNIWMKTKNLTGIVILHALIDAWFMCELAC